MVTIKMTTAATKLDRTIDVLHAADRSVPADNAIFARKFIARDISDEDS
jgi:hypothetical protein